MLFINS